MHSKIDAAPTYPFHQNRYNKPNDIPYLSSLRQISFDTQGGAQSIKYQRGHMLSSVVEFGCRNKGIVEFESGIWQLMKDQRSAPETRTRLKY